MSPKVRIKRKIWWKFKDHAIECFPEECIGAFECQETENGDLEVTNVYTCRNIARNKKFEGQVSKPDMRNLKKISRRGNRKGLSYGIFHSHPMSGSVKLSDIDVFSAKIYKLFKLQIILGITKSKRIRKSFWKYEKPEMLEKKVEVY